MTSDIEGARDEMRSEAQVEAIDRGMQALADRFDEPRRLLTIYLPMEAADFAAILDIVARANPGAVMKSESLEVVHVLSHGRE